MKSGVPPLRRLLVAVLGAAVAALSTATADGQARAPSRPVQVVLEGGLTVIAEEQRGTDIVALHTWVRAGSKDEDDETSGAAHFLEHMLFKGTARRRAEEISREVEGAGGVLNAGTSMDWTYYYVVATGRQFDRMLDLQSDALMNSLVDPVEMERERRVVLEEINRRDSSPATRAHELLRATLFTVHPYRRSVLGTRDAIERMPREALLRFHRTHYIPASMTVVVVGNIRTDEAVARVRQAYSGFQARPAARSQRPVEPPLEAVRRAEIEGDVRVTYMAIGFAGPAVSDPDSDAADVLMYALGRGLGARLRVRIVEGANLAQSVTTSYLSTEDPSPFVVSAVVDPALAARAEAAIISELRAVAEEGISEAELTRAKNLLEGEHAYGSHTTRGRAFSLGFYATVADLGFGLSYVERVRRIGQEDVRRAARRILDPRRYAVAVIRPGGR